VYYDPANYGPVGLGDDTDALQGALNACGAAAAGGYVGLDAGTYKTTRGLLFKSEKTQLVGEGLNNTVINYRGTGGYALTFGRWDMDRTVPALAANWRGLAMSDFCIDGTGSNNAAGAVHVWGATRYAVDRVWVKAFGLGSGFHVHSSWVGRFNDCQCQDCRYGYKFTHPGDTGSQAFNGVSVQGGEIQAGRVGVMVGEESGVYPFGNPIGTGLALRDVTIEGQSLWGVWAADGTDVLVDHCYFEAVGRAPEGGGPAGAVRVGSADATCRRARLRDCGLVGGCGGGSPLASVVYLDKSDQPVVEGFSLDTQSSGVTGVRATAGAQNVLVRHCFVPAKILNEGVPFNLAAANGYVLQRLDDAGLGESEYSFRPHRFRSDNFLPVLTDTAGKTLVQLEAEVNAAKAAQRTFGSAR
jgi:hypothetical protein